MVKMFGLEGACLMREEEEGHLEEIELLISRI